MRKRAGKGRLARSVTIESIPRPNSLRFSSSGPSRSGFGESEGVGGMLNTALRIAKEAQALVMTWLLEGAGCQ